MSPDHPGAASASSASVHGPIILIPDLRRRLLGRLPHCARGRVLEQDAPGAELLADRVRSAEVLAPAGLVALADRGRDCRLPEPGAGGASRPQLAEELRRPLAQAAEAGGDAPLRRA